MKRRTLLAIRWVLGTIFLYSGVIKASSSARFAIALAPFTLIPENWIQPLSMALPLCEVVAGVLLVLPPTRRLGGWLILGLCLVFILALGWALANGIIVSCSCFGEEDQPSVSKMILALIRDIILAGLAIIVLLERPSTSSTKRNDRRRDPADAR
ncbi:MAG TPA: MauE/DoxX family redox-associated membrane protein [Terrimicrobiaceae bacterium]